MPCKSCSTLAHNTELSWRATYSECKHDTVSAYLPVRSGSHWSIKKVQGSNIKDTRLNLWPTEAKNLCSENPTDLVSRLAATSKDSQTRPKVGPWVRNTKAAKQLLSSWGLDLQQHTGFPLKHITHCGAVLQCSAEIKGTQAKVDGVNSTSSCGFLNMSTVYYFANASKKQPHRTWKSNRIHLNPFDVIHWCSLMFIDVHWLSCFWAASPGFLTQRSLVGRTSHWLRP